MKKDQQRFELRFAKYFSDWFNSKNNFDYKPQVFQEQGSEIDVQLTSDFLPTLNLQMVTTMGPVLKSGIVNTKRFNQGLDMQAHAVDIVGWITKAIWDKESKYPVSLKEGLILIVQGSIPAPEPSDIQRDYLGKFNKTNFKGIYYVSATAATGVFVEPIKPV